VLCLQETWLTQSATTLDIPGYQVFEQRRSTGKRGGIAIIVRNGIQVIRHVGNEFSQGVCLQVHGGEKLWVGNVYMPPIQNLQKRRVDETVTRSLIEDTLGSFQNSMTHVICGD
jgi:exonuclease III